MRWIITILALVVAFPCFAFENVSQREDPLEWLESLNELNLKRIHEAVKEIEKKDAYSLWQVAELEKRLGVDKAEQHYREAIKADPNEPSYELFFADYFRNIRGPKRPLFPEAEKHYYAALRKLSRPAKSPLWLKHYDEIKKRVERGLVALYQEDGLAVLYRNSDGANEERRPMLFFGTINQYAHSTTNPDRVDDSRSFTSEALFSSSQNRLNRPLTTNELEKIARKKEIFETFNRLRLRYEDLPVIDIFYKHRQIGDAQITNFFLPTQFNDVRVNEFGIAAEKPYSISGNLDAFLRGIYSRIARKGTIEFLPDDVEEINQFQVQGALSQFFGPDKAILEVSYVYQDINPDIPNPPKRDREIFSSTLTYQLLRSLSHLAPFYGGPFATRGVDIYGGYARDVETFGEVDIRKNDFFAGCSIKGIGPIDLTIQPTFFSGDVEGDSSQDTAMYRTNFTFLYRILDEEASPGYPPDSYKFMGVYPAFLHFIIPFRHDVAVSGLDTFENYKIGIELAAKFITIKSSKTTFLAALGYDYQRFPNLDKGMNLFRFTISMGF